MNETIAAIKQHHRRELAKVPFDLKIAILIKMQMMAREMAEASGRPFTGVVWGEDRPSIRPEPAENTGDHDLLS